MCKSQLGQIQFSPSGIYFIFIKLWNLEPLGTVVIFRQGSIDLILQLSLHQIQIALIDGRILLSFSFANLHLHSSCVLSI